MNKIKDIISLIQKSKKLTQTKSKIVLIIIKILNKNKTLCNNPITSLDKILKLSMTNKHPLISQIPNKLLKTNKIKS
jgi:hypothetical protein